MFILSLAVALLMAVTSLLSLFFQTTTYQTEELRRSFVSNDVVNLLIGLPILLGALLHGAAVQVTIGEIARSVFIYRAFLFWRVS